MAVALLNAGKEQPSDADFDMVKILQAIDQLLSTLREADSLNRRRTDSSYDEWKLNDTNPSSQDYRNRNGFVPVVSSQQTPPKRARQSLHLLLPTRPTTNTATKDRRRQNRDNRSSNSRSDSSARGYHNTSNQHSRRSNLSPRRDGVVTNHTSTNTARKVANNSRY